MDTRRPRLQLDRDLRGHEGLPILRSQALRMAECGPDARVQGQDEASPRAVLPLQFHDFPLGWYEEFQELLHSPSAARRLPPGGVEPVLPQVFTLDGGLASIRHHEGFWCLPLWFTRR